MDKRVEIEKALALAAIQIGQWKHSAATFGVPYPEMLQLEEDQGDTSICDRLIGTIASLSIHSVKSNARADFAKELKCALIRTRLMINKRCELDKTDYRMTVYAAFDKFITRVERIALP